MSQEKLKRAPVSMIEQFNKLAEKRKKAKENNPKPTAHQITQRKQTK
jgi:DNA-directed RNA polymerase sigma subunit (sigma70/sigma32)